MKRVLSLVKSGFSLMKRVLLHVKNGFSLLRIHFYRFINKRRQIETEVGAGEVPPEEKKIDFRQKKLANYLESTEAGYKFATDSSNNNH